MPAQDKAYPIELITGNENAEHTCQWNKDHLSVRRSRQGVSHDTFKLFGFQNNLLPAFIRTNSH
jgi:hypothetical protein